jgi:hypothetical protein
MVVCFALFQRAQAVSPPPDAGYSGGNTAEGQDALLTLTAGTYNTAIGMVNAMLLNEFLKEHRKMQEQEATIAQLKNDFRATVAQLAARLDEQALQIQKMTARLEASKMTPQVVFNKR